MVEKNGKHKRKTHRCRLLLENRKWGMVVVGSYSLCGVRIRRGGDSLDKNPIVVIFMVVELKMRRERSCVLSNLISLGYHLCGYEKVLIYSYTFWCHIFDLNL